MIKSFFFLLCILLMILILCIFFFLCMWSGVSFMRLQDVHLNQITKKKGYFLYVWFTVKETVLLRFEWLHLGFASRTPQSNEEPVFVERHGRVESRSVGSHKLLYGLYGYVALWIVEEGEGNALFAWIHNHSMLHALVDCVAQNLINWSANRQ